MMKSNKEQFVDIPARKAIRDYALTVARDADTFAKRSNACVVAFVLSVTAHESLETASVLLAPLAPRISDRDTYYLGADWQHVTYMQPLEDQLDTDGVSFGDKWFAVLGFELSGAAERLLFDRLHRRGFLRTMELSIAFPCATRNLALHDRWVTLVALKRDTCDGDVTVRRKHQWPHHSLRGVYRMLRHYASVDRFFMRRRLWNVTTHAKVWNRDVIDTILEFLYGVFSTEKRFFRETFTVTRAAVATPER